MFKKVYDPKVRDLRPSSSILQRRIKFNKDKRVGEEYRVSVVLRPPNGFTYVGSAGAITALKAARNMVQKQAALTPFEIDLREQIALTVLSRAVEEGEGAFVNSTKAIVAGMQMSSANRIEASMLHGQRGYGTVESATDNGDGTCNVGFTAATWAPGLWQALGEGSTWDSFTSTTKNNGTAVLVLQSITQSTRTVKFTFSGTLATEVAAGDVFFPEGANAGAGTHNDMPGLLAQASNTSGTSLGLSAATYSNWAGNTYDFAGPLSLEGVEDFLSQLRDRGAEGMLSVLLPNKGYSVLHSQVNQLRQIDQSYSAEKAKIGQKAIGYASPEVGDIEFINHPFMKRGELAVLPLEECSRVGSSDITFEIPGMKEKFFRMLDGYNAVELANFTDQAVIDCKPNHSGVGTGITY